MKTLSAIVALSLCLCGGAVRAQAVSDPVQQARADLNNREAALAEQQMVQNAVNRQEYDMAVANRNDVMGRLHQSEIAAQADYDAALLDYRQAMRLWRADVAACNAGDAARCAPPAP